MSLDLNDLGDLSREADKDQSSVELDIDLIDEDPDQPRTEFDDETLNELAETIKERGVKSPISVRHAGDGRFMVNHGARRLRASRLAGKTTIPAFIDDDYTRIDQIIENIQRDNLKPMEIARFIKAEIEERGLLQADIAKELGKKKTWVSNMFGLTKLCPAILDVFQRGLIDSVDAALELQRLHKQEPDRVEQFLSGVPEVITVRDVRNLAKIIKASDAFGDYTTTKETIEPNDFIDETQPDDLGSDSEDADPVTESDEPDNTGAAGDNTATAQQEEMQDLNDLDDIKDDDTNDSAKLFKTVREIRCRCDDYGEVTVVFRPAQADKHVVVLTGDGVREVAASSLTLLRVAF